MKQVHFHELIPLFPLLLFVFGLNAVRGGGEVIVHYGPLIILKQGLVRGVFFTGVIMEMFLASKVLTAGFSPEELFSALYTLDGSLSSVGNLFTRQDTGKGKNGSRQYFFLVLYYVLQIFKYIYAEIPRFFRSKHVRLKKRTVQFIHSVYNRSYGEYTRIKQKRFVTLRISPRDYVYIGSQMILFSSVFILKMIFE
jgi:energy-coupling factor transporter transmembrane protein EcfT